MFSIFGHNLGVRQATHWLGTSEVHGLQSRLVTLTGAFHPRPHGSLSATVLQTPGSLPAALSMSKISATDRALSS